MLWVSHHPAKGTGVLVSLTATALQVIEGDSETLQELAQPAHADVLPQAFAKHGTQILLEKMVVLLADEKDTCLTVKHVSRSLRSKHGIEGEAIRFGDHQVRDQVLQALQEVFGDKGKFSRTVYSPARAALAPLAVAAAVMGISLLLIWLPSRGDAGDGRPGYWKARILEQLVSTLVAVLGVTGFRCLVVAGALVGLFFVGRGLQRRVANPPIMLRLKILPGWKPTRTSSNGDELTADVAEHPSGAGSG